MTLIQTFFLSLLGILTEMSPYVLLGFLLAGLLHEFVRPQAMSRQLGGKGWKPVVKAALLGVPLPLCSCGVLPTAIGLRREGAGRGATTSFLIATPQTGVDSIAATYSLLGPAFAVLRPLAALVGGVLGGWSVSLAEDKGETDETVLDSATAGQKKKKALPVRILAAIRYGLVDMVASVGKWLVIGLVAAALITTLVPESLFTGLAAHPWLAMIVMVIVAVPMYICATGSIPIALSLMLKGLTPGVAFVLLMAGPAVNFASFLVLQKSLGRRATMVYIASVVVTALFFGLVIDYILPASWFALHEGGTDICCHTTFSWTGLSGTVILLAALAYALGRRRNQCDLSSENEKDCCTFLIRGMKCEHCQNSVEKSIAAVEGAKQVTVDLKKGRAVVKGPVDHKKVREAIERCGFDCEDS